jgi:chemotaxis signal transduction protein
MSDPAADASDARTTAPVGAGEPSSGDARALVLFRRDGRTWALPLDQVSGSGRLRELTVVPGGPDWLVGAVHESGRVLSLLDLPRFWGQPLRGATDLPLYLVMGRGVEAIGVVVEQLRGVVESYPGLALPPEGSPPGAVGLLEAAGESVLVLHADQLFRDPRLRAGRHG